MKIQDIPVVVGASRTVPKCLEKGLEDWKFVG